MQIPMVVLFYDELSLDVKPYFSENVVGEKKNQFLNTFYVPIAWNTTLI